jgi:hypothetical protein
MSIDSMTEAQRDQAKARQVYLDSCAAGDPITGAALAERFGRQERWGQERIAEAKAAARTSPVSPAAVLPAVSLPPVTPPRAETADEGQEAPASPWWKPWKRKAVKEPSKRSVRKAQKQQSKAAPALIRAKAKPVASAAPSAETAQPQPRGAAASAWLALVLGVGASVGANILHTVLVVGGGNGNVPQVIGAAFWPVALVVAIEVMARVRWPRSVGYALIRFAGVGAVAGVAAVVSYKHMAGLLTYWGEDALSAHLGPIAVDGLVTVGALALLAIHKTRKES